MLTTPWLLAMAIAFALVAIIFAFLWVRALDEAKQQAHYIAWYWGGSAGLGFSALVLVGFLPFIVQPDEFERLFSGAILPPTVSCCGLAVRSKAVIAPR